MARAGKVTITYIDPDTGLETDVKPESLKRKENLNKENKKPFKQKEFQVKDKVIFADAGLSHLRIHYGRVKDVTDEYVLVLENGKKKPFKYKFHPEGHLEGNGDKPPFDTQHKHQLFHSVEERAQYAESIGMIFAMECGKEFAKARKKRNKKYRRGEVANE